MIPGAEACAHIVAELDSSAKSEKSGENVGASENGFHCCREMRWMYQGQPLAPL